MRKLYFIEFDALRFFALLLILYVHSPGYIPEIPVLEYFRDAISYTGLGLFVFLSGYGLQNSVRLKQATGQFQPMVFLKRRLLRIYPLYLVALLVFVVVFHGLGIYHSGPGWDFSPLLPVFLVHLLSLQVLFYPHIPLINTLWFIGLMIPLYVVFAGTAHRKTGQFLWVNGVIFLLLLAMKQAWGVIDPRLFLYYPVFILGCFCSRKQLMPLPESGKSWMAVGGTGLAMLLVYFLMDRLNISGLPSDGIQVFEDVTNYLLPFAYISLSLFFCLAVCSRVAQGLNWHQTLIIKLSALSYPAFLFHRVVYALFYELLLNQIRVSDQIATLLFPVTTGVLIGLALLICILEEIIFKKLTVQAN